MIPELNILVTIAFVITTVSWVVLTAGAAVRKEKGLLESIYMGPERRVLRRTTREYNVKDIDQLYRKLRLVEQQNKSLRAVNRAKFELQARFSKKELYAVESGKGQNLCSND